MDNAKMLEAVEFVNDYIDDKMNGVICRFSIDDIDVTEVAIIKPDKVDKLVKYRFGLGVYPDNSDKSRSFIEDPYFKIFDGDNPNNSNHVTRIKILKPEYVIHYKQKWDLNSKMKDALMKVLKSNLRENVTVWDAILLACIPDKNNLKKYEDFLKSPIPDYTQLKAPK